jgi:hypothetical protein
MSVKMITLAQTPRSFPFLSFRFALQSLPAKLALGALNPGSDFNFVRLRISFFAKSLILVSAWKILPKSRAGRVFRLKGSDGRLFTAPRWGWDAELRELIFFGMGCQHVDQLMSL